MSEEAEKVPATGKLWRRGTLVYTTPALVMAAFSSVPFNLFSIFYAKSLAMDMALYGKLIAASYLVSFVLSYFLGSIADRFHPLRASMGTLILYFAVMFAGWLTVRDVRSFGIMLILHVVLSGCYATVSASLGARLFPRAFYAQFNSAYMMIFGLANAVVGPCLGWCVDLLGRNYRSTFLFGMIVAGSGLLLLSKVYFDFLKFGGDRSYTPPAPERR